MAIYSPVTEINMFTSAVFDMCYWSGVKLHLLYIPQSSVSINEGEFFPLLTILSPIKMSGLNLNVFPHTGPFLKKK